MRGWGGEGKSSTKRKMHGEGGGEEEDKRVLSNEGEKNKQELSEEKKTQK